MNWRDSLHKVRHPDGRVLIGASFRGVAFFVPESNRTGGRRTYRHEFAFNDQSFVDDFGRRGRVFSVEGYVLGDEYVAQRDRLCAALEDVAGPGELIHPYHGIRSAICSQMSVRESSSDGRLARFTLEFEEAPPLALLPRAELDPTGTVDESATATRTAIVSEFVSSYDPEGLPSYALASASVALSTATTAVRDRLGPVIGATQELATLNGKANILVAQATSLVREPDRILTAFADTFSDLAETILAAPRAVLDAFVSAYAIDFGGPGLGATPSRVRERANHAALSSALRRFMVVESARMAPRVVFDSIEDATTTRNQIAEQLEEQATTAGDVAYPALVQLRTDLLRTVPGDQVLARIVRIERRVAVPSLLLSYQLYGTVDREADLLARNRIRHPALVAGELEVLTDV